MTESTKKQHGGYRENSGRKKSAHKGETRVIRVDIALIPMIERLKNGCDFVAESKQSDNSAALVAEIERLNQANEKLVLKRDAEYLRANDLENKNRELKNTLEKLTVRLESSESESNVLAGKLASVESEFTEQGKLIMKLVKEKKNLEINLGLKKPAQKVESVPFNPVKTSPVKANPVNLQGISGATAKNAKVTLVIDPATIPRVDSTGKKQTALKIAVETMSFQADLNSKSYRKAIASIDELGAENCTAILQGSMKTQGKLEGVGLVIQAKKAKEEPSEIPIPIE